MPERLDGICVVLRYRVRCCPLDLPVLPDDLLVRVQTPDELGGIAHRLNNFRVHLVLAKHGGVDRLVGDVVDLRGYRALYSLCKFEYTGCRTTRNISICTEASDY